MWRALTATTLDAPDMAFGVRHVRQGVREDFGKEVYVSSALFQALLNTANAPPAATNKLPMPRFVQRMCSGSFSIISTFAANAV